MATSRGMITGASVGVGESMDVSGAPDVVDASVDVVESTDGSMTIFRLAATSTYCARRIVADVSM